MSIRETIREVPATQKSVTEYFCDWCGTRIHDSYLSLHACDWCGRLACDKCRTGWQTIGDGDYPERCCPECWKIGEPHRAKVEQLEELEEAEQEAWRVEAEVAATNAPRAEPREAPPEPTTIETFPTRPPF
ncbi:MAG: hypothetical protein IMZ62_12890 [Chloroflexi bacterium]|nr:hypothetical protein [Chloroflexota bacterium]MBE3119100.1 hypothetical protein [Candidatus Atribacteria bacterium]